MPRLLKGLFLSLMLIVTVSFVGIFQPVIAVALALVAFVFGGFIGIIFLDWTYLILLIILGVLTLYRLSQAR